MRTLFTFFCIYLVSFAFGQNGYRIEFLSKKINHDSIKLKIYKSTPKKTYTIEKVVLEKKKTEIKEDKKIIDAIYRLEYADDEETYINLAIDNGSNIELVLDNDLKKISTTDPINSLFIKAQNALNLKERNDAWKEIIEKHPQSVAALYAQLELLQSPEPEQYATKEKAEKYRDEYFSNVDLNDKRLELLPNLYASLYSLVKVMPITNENYQKAVDVMLKDQNCDSRNYQMYLSWIFQNLEFLNRYNLYDTYYYVFNTYLNQGKCIANDEVFYQDIVRRLQSYEKLPIGSTIPDFDMVDADGKRYEIKDLYPENDFTFLAFYDPNCSHCKEKMPKINEYFNTLKAENPDLSIKQIAFLNAESDYEWKNFIKKNNLNNWQHVKSDDPNYRYIKKLDVFANPAFFLVNKKGELLLKNYNPSEMSKIFLGE